jgi:hypothetical protein
VALSQESNDAPGKLTVKASNGKEVKKDCYATVVAQDKDDRAKDAERSLPESIKHEQG